MDFSFKDVPVVDGHIHFSHPERMDDLLAIMETVPLARANLVSTPNRRSINQNPALIHFKAHYPHRVYLSGGLDYTQVFADRDRASEILAAQIATLQAIGFDGLKLIEGKPTARKWIPISLDAPEYEGMWTALEELDMPVILHVADPEEFWDQERVPAWARHAGWFYGDGAYPTKEDLYAEVDHILERHPGLKIIFAHFYFLSADLARAGKFFDAHPTICFDLTPGSEMYANFTRNYDAARAFFIQYQDRLVYGTDISIRAMERTGERGLAQPLSCSWFVRTFLEADDVFTPPEEIAHWLESDLDGFRGLALPRDVLEKIYHANFERMFGPMPAPLDRQAAIVELERMAAVIDAQAEGGPVESQARQVVKELSASLLSLGTKPQVPRLGPERPSRV